MESQQSQDSSRQFLSFQSLLEQPQSHNMVSGCETRGMACCSGSGEAGMIRMVQ